MPLQLVAWGLILNRCLFNRRGAESTKNVCLDLNLIELARGERTLLEDRQTWTKKDVMNVSDEDVNTRKKVV